MAVKHRLPPPVPPKKKNLGTFENKTWKVSNMCTSLEKLMWRKKSDKELQIEISYQLHKWTKDAIGSRDT